MSWHAGTFHTFIEAIYAFADGFGTASVYWLTQEYNTHGTVYDTLASHTQRLTGPAWRGRCRSSPAVPLSSSRGGCCCWPRWTGDEVEQAL
jgi:hypothetical protein